MKIKCPKCKTNYSVEDASIPENGIVMKCSVCGSTFRVKRKTQKNTIIPELESETVENQTDDLLDDLFENDAANENSSEKNIDKESENSQNTEDLSDLFDDDEDDEEIDVENLFVKSTTNSIDENEKTVNFNSANLNSNDSEKTKSASIEPDDFLKDLFSEDEDSEDDLETQLNAKIDLDKDDDFSTPQSSEDSFYLKKRNDDSILGPYSQSEVDNLIQNGTIATDDFISSDGVSWSQIATDNQSKPSISLETETQEDDFKLFEDDEDDEVPVFEEKTRLSIEDDEFNSINNSDSIPEFKEYTTTVTQKATVRVEHTFIPETQKEKLSRKKSSKISEIVFSIFRIVIALGLLFSVGFGGWYAYNNFFKKKKSTEIFDKISESLSDNVSGTLSDVRDSFRKDLEPDYEKGIIILKKYMNASKVAPEVIALDSLIKLNLYLSYGKKLDSFDNIESRINDYISKYPKNADLLKAKAFLEFVKGNYAKSAEILQPFAKSKDSEALFILGLASIKQKKIKPARIFLNSAFVRSQGKDNRIVFALAKLKNSQGDTQGAIAYLNKILNLTPNYFKAYLEKANILLNEENGERLALNFLKNIKSSTLSMATKQQQAKYYMLLSKIYYSRGSIAKALDYLKKVLFIDGNNLDYLTKMGDLYLSMRNSGEALKYYVKVLKINPNYIPAILGKAQALVELKSPNKAFMEISKINVKQIKNAKYFVKLGNIYYSLGESQKAISYFDKAIKLNPALIDAYMQKTIVLLDSNNTDEIKNMAIQIGKINKESYAYYLVNAILNHKDAEYGKAKYFFQKAIEKNTFNDAWVYFYYGQLLLDSNNNKTAIKMLLKAYNLNPANYDFRIALAKALIEAKKYEDAIPILQKDNEQYAGNSKFYKSLTMLSDSYFKMGDYENALKFINQAILRKSQISYLFYKKALILYKAKKYEQASDAINSAIMLDLKNFDNYILYAKILIKQGNFRTAIEQINDAEKINPSSEELYLIKGIVFRNLDNYYASLKYLKKIKSKKLKKLAYATMGDCYAQLGIAKKALQYMKKALNNGNYQVAEKLAKIYYENGKINQAINLYKKALVYNKRNLDVIKKLAYIYKEKKLYSKALYYFKRYLKLVDDETEEEMMKDEIYYLKKNMSSTEYKKVVTSVSQSGDISEKQLKKIRKLYMQGRMLMSDEPGKAKEIFKQILSEVPKNNKYYRKTFKLFRKLK